MKTLSDIFFEIRLFLIKRLRGEAACADAMLDRVCKQLARRLESKSYRGYVAKRRIARYLDLTVSYVGEAAESLGIQHETVNRSLYYKTRDAVTILKLLR